MCLVPQDLRAKEGKIMQFPPEGIMGLGDTTLPGDSAEPKSFSLSATINNAFRRSAAFA